MDNWLLPLQIFPEGALASSIITTVWVGVFVAVFFNLRFGWVLSGLVVSGYLVPILIVQPWSFFVILLQASIAYALVRAYSEWFSGPASWSALFGRDRFVAILIASVAVRLGFDGWVLPLLAAELDSRFGVLINWQINLHSFGLVVMALLANQLWKPGYLRGMGHALTMIGLTYVAVRYGLMEWTNFRISGIYYLYEDFASSILATPKAYVILISTVLIASQMNLRYGWDFGGVLIPALVALQWYQPLKVLTSFAEAFIILGIAIVIIRLPVLANTTIEGGRKLLLFFNISFGLRFLLGHIFYWGDIEQHTTDYFGFGYLLATLLAIKMYEKNSALRVASATVQVSLAGVAVGTGIGFTMSGWLTNPAPASLARIEPFDDRSRRSATAAEIAARASVQAYSHWRAAPFEFAPPASLQSLRRAASLLLNGPPSLQAIEEASALLAVAGFDLSETTDGFLAITQRYPTRLGGSFLINPEAATNLIISVPYPVALPGTSLAALALMREAEARAVAFGGSGTAAPGLLDLDLRALDGTYFQAFHEGSWGGIVSLNPAPLGQPAAVLRVPARVPAGLDLRRIETMLGRIDTGFGRVESRGLQEAAAFDGYAQLVLGPEHLRLLGPQGSLGEARMLEPLEAGLLTTAHDYTGSNAILSLPELLYLDREILTPLLREVAPNWTEAPAANLRAELASITEVAIAAGHHMSFHDGDDPYVVLQARSGTFVLRLGQSPSGHIVHVPSPGENGALLSAGVALFQRLNAAALLADDWSGVSLSDLAVTDDAERPGRAQLSDLALQVTLRETDSDILVSQVRDVSLARRSDFTVGAALAFGVIAHDRGRLEAELFDALGQITDQLKVVIGQEDTAGLETNASRQSRQVQSDAGASFATIWLSQATQSALRNRRPARAEEAVFTALGIETVERSLTDFIGTLTLAAAQPVHERLREMVLHFLERRDIVALHSAMVGFPELNFIRLMDPVSGQSFLCIVDPNGLVAAVNLQPIDARDVSILSDATDAEGVRRFIAQRGGWLKGDTQ
jgi:gamma-polyglutamate biosynthesis protein CapC